MSDTRKKNINWIIKTNEDGTTPHGDAQLAVLMDIRDELREINSRLGCGSFQRLPYTIDMIRRYTQRIPARKPRKKKES